MAAATAYGKINIKLMDTTNSSFTEQPFYTNYNFLQDNQSDAATYANAMNNNLTDFIETLSNNVVTDISVSYEVSLGGFDDANS